MSWRNSEDELLSGHIMCYKFMRVDNLKALSFSLCLSVFRWKFPAKLKTTIERSMKVCSREILGSFAAARLASCHLTTAYVELNLNFCKQEIKELDNDSTATETRRKRLM